MDREILKDKKIFLIEDNDFLSSVIVRKLQAIGAYVELYKNGKDGIDAIRGGHPDLVFLDIMMPLMNGYEVLEIMQKEDLFQKSPVIVISNSGQPVETQRVKDMGVSDYVIKANFTPEEVLQKAREVLSRKNTPTTKTQPSQNVSAAVSETPEPKTTTQLEKKPPPEAPKNNIKILIVEDDHMLRNLLSTKLAKNGYTLLTAEDGAEALKLAESTLPDIIILDLMIPGLDGFEVLKKIKEDETLKATPVLVFSNMSEAENQERALKLGAAGYHIKAMTDLNDVVTDIQTCLNDTTK